MSNEITTKPAISDLMADRYNLSVDAFKATFKAIAMPKGAHSEAEFASCCIVAHEHNLNPLTKEIYFMKTQGGAIQPIVSVDGWVKKCNEHPEYGGVEFEDHMDEGKLTAITARIHRKDRTVPIAVTEYMSECAGSSPAWKKTPARMLRHRAMMQAARYAFGFAGIMDVDEFSQWQGIRDVTPPTPPAPPPVENESQDIEDAVELPDYERIISDAEAQMGTCKDMDSLNEAWVELEGHELDGEWEQRCFQIYSDNEDRINREMAA